MEAEYFRWSQCFITMTVDKIPQKKQHIFNLSCDTFWHSLTYTYKFVVQCWFKTVQVGFSAKLYPSNIQHTHLHSVRVLLSNVNTHQIPLIFIFGIYKFHIGISLFSPFWDLLLCPSYLKKKEDSNKQIVNTHLPFLLKHEKYIK